MTVAPATAAPVTARGPVTHADLFFGFAKVGLMGFGGIAPVARHIIVQERGWLTDEEYAAILGLGQVLPGPNTTNASIMIGDRFQGPTGALAALVGLMAMPLVILVLLALLYARFEAFGVVGDAVSGAAAGAAGLVIGTALKMARVLPRRAVTILFGVLAFVAVGVAQLPLVPVVMVLVPLSVLAQFLSTWVRAS